MSPKHRRYARNLLARNIAEMQLQRQARTERRDRLIVLLQGYEAWRERTGRPIASVDI